MTITTKTKSRRWWETQVRSFHGFRSYNTKDRNKKEKEKEDLNEYGKTGKTQFKINIVKGKEEQLKTETENFSLHCGKKTKKKQNIKK